MLRFNGWFLALSFVVLSASSADAATMFFDFGYDTSKSATSNYNDVVIDGTGGVRPQPIVIPAPEVIDSTGASTGASLSAKGFFPGGNPNGTAVPPGPSGDAAANFVASATADNFFTHVGSFGGQATNPKGTVTLSGLNDAIAYDFTFFACRQPAPDNRETKYTVTGGTSAFALLNPSNNYSNVAIVNDIFPTGGVITIDVEAGPNNNNGATKFAYLGAMRVDYTNVPEPSTLALVGLLGLGLVFRRRSM